jgi:hypothetical protein
MYNLGDTIEIEATIKPSQDASGFFELDLECGNESENFYKSPLSLEAGQQETKKTSLALTKSFLGNMGGECNVKAMFLNEEVKSQKFEISDKIDVILNIENMSIKSGEEITVRGNALKKNGEQVEGFLELRIEKTDIKITRTVSEGNFVADFKFPENTRAGNYVLIARVYEKVGGEETNSGEARVTLNIKSIPKKIEIAISKQNIEPGNNISFRPMIYDQANEEIGGDISIKIYDSFDEIIFQKILKSGEEHTLYLETNQSSGYWIIVANSLGLETKRLFYVEELEKAKFEIINDTLIITNIGNVVYRKPVQISIGDIVEVESINLDVGKSKSFRLLAPDGNYNIEVTDGDTILKVSGVSLTGNIIGVSEVKKHLGVVTRYPVVWLFLIVILGFFILMIAQRVVKRKFYAFPVSKETKEVKVQGKVTPIAIKKKPEGKEKKLPELKTPIPGEVRKAEHSLVLSGRKENTGVVAVKIKDLNDMRKVAGNTINSIVKAVVDNRGVIYETSDYIIAIFSSATTKTFDNEMLAVKVSRQINSILKEHNKRSKERISYGISLNSGELILKKDVDKLRFTNVGNTLILSKRIADLARNEVLVSEDLKKRVAAEVKTDKEIREGIEVHHIRSIMDRDRNREFISDFLRRQKGQVE